MIPSTAKSWSSVNCPPLLLTIALIIMAGCNGSRQSVADSAPTPNDTKAAATDAEHTGTDKKPAEITLTPDALQKYSIKTDHAQAQLFTPTFAAPGEVSFDPDRVSQVGSAVTGRVADLKAHLGDRVEKGSELIVIDSTELGTAQGEHLQKRTVLDVSGPAVALAKSAYERVKGLAQSEVVGLAEVQRREGELKAAEGNSRMAAAAADASTNRLHLLGMTDDAIAQLETSKKIDSKFIVRSPIPGQVMERPITLGELVGPDKPSLITIVDPSIVRVLADVPQARLIDLHVGAAARIKTDERAKVLDGTVSFIPPQLDPATRTARVRINVKNDAGLLRAGMFCQVELSTAASTADSAKVVIVPEEAVQNVDGTPSIFVPVRGKEYTYACRAIQVGRTSGGKVIVEKGLNVGEPFVSSGTFTLKAELGKSSLEE